MCLIYFSAQEKGFPLSQFEVHLRIYQRFLLWKHHGDDTSLKISLRERERMNDDLMEINDTELNYVYFGDKTDSDDTR